MIDQVISRDAIRRNAEQAADTIQGIKANPYPADSVAHVEWQQAYVSRARQVTGTQHILREYA